MHFQSPRPTSSKSFLILSPICVSAFLNVSFPQVFSLKLCMHFWIVLYVLRVLPIVSRLDLRFVIMLSEEYFTIHVIQHYVTFSIALLCRLSCTKNLSHGCSKVAHCVPAR